MALPETDRLIKQTDKIEIVKKIIMSKYGFSFSLSRLLGIAQAKQKFARTTGIPTTKSGMQRKIGASILKMFFK